MTLIQSLHEKALTLALAFKKAEHELLEILQQVEAHGVHKRLGFPSVFAYATQSLKLSENYAYTLITVSRKAAEVPVLKEAIAQGEISVSQAKRIASVVSKENGSQWIARAKTLTQRQLDKAVARERPQECVPEKIKYVQSDRLQLQCGISEELMNKLTRAKDVLSQKRKKAVSLEETLEAMTTLYLEREDPIRKAERNMLKTPKQQVSRRAPPERQRRPIPTQVKHRVIARDRGRCTYVGNNGHQCEQERWIACHHVRPVSQGGNHTPDNLTLLCQFHHRMVHTKEGVQSFLQ